MNYFNKNVLKRIACIMLACATLVSFSACNGRDKPSTSEDSSNSSSQSSSSDSSSQSSDSSSSSDNSSNVDMSSSEDKSSSTADDSKKTVKEKLADAKKVNSDVVAWINIPNTEIDNEVLQHNDIAYYHRKDITKTYQWYGCYYSDPHNIFKTSKDLTPNTIIYGHNMEDRPNGKKFAQLFNYLNADFAKNNPYIYLTTEDEELVFQVYAVFYSDTKFNYIIYDPAKESKFKTSMKDIIAGGQERSEFIYDVDVNSNDKLLTLSTCTYKFGGEKNNEQRFVVQARLLRNGEKINETVSVKKNPSPKQPTFSKSYN